MANEIAVRKSNLALQEVGKREVSVNGWRTDLVVGHIKWHMGQPGHEGKWCEVECMARIFYQRNCPENRRKVRRNLPRLFDALLTEGLFLLREFAYGRTTHGQAQACKILTRDDRTELEVQAAVSQIDRLESRRELAGNKLLAARAAVGV